MIALRCNAPFHMHMTLELQAWQGEPFRGILDQICRMKKMKNICRPDPAMSCLIGIGAWMQGSGFSEVIAALESELKSVRASHAALTDDNKGCYTLIRAKDKELDAAAVQVEAANAIAVENKVRMLSMIVLKARRTDVRNQMQVASAEGSFVSYWLLAYF